MSFFRAVFFLCVAVFCQEESWGWWEPPKARFALAFFSSFFHACQERDGSGGLAGWGGGWEDGQGFLGRGSLFFRARQEAAWGPSRGNETFRRCNFFPAQSSMNTNPLEGTAGTFGSRTKLAQVCPYQFCQDLAHILLRHLKVKPLDNEVYLLEDLFEPFTIKQVDILRKEMEAIDKEFNMTSSSLAVRIQELPFNKDVQPLVIQDLLVQKFQKTMKQYPPGTEIDIFKQDPNDWRCQNMWNGCKKLRQLCISSTQYDCMHRIRPHHRHQYAHNYVTSGRCDHILLAA